MLARVGSRFGIPREPQLNGLPAVLLRNRSRERQRFVPVIESLRKLGSEPPRDRFERSLSVH